MRSNQDYFQPNRCTPSPCQERKYGSCLLLAAWAPNKRMQTCSPGLLSQSNSTSHANISRLNAVLNWKGYRIVILTYPAVCLAVSCDYSQRDLHN
jgi:hypothetical protein